MISRLVFLGSLNHIETGFWGLQNGFFGISSGGYREMGVLKAVGFSVHDFSLRNMISQLKKG